ncbi:ABC transporter substrate-binding protein [Roseateles aquatilis]|uniref:ABC transporter substrate-binding protein n=1 Tax=Roseateles aquatilis TaxID=431061 RepID=A0A246JH67_9BURK|nr:ABC transporter substrate-binding protein [Roseateles aquatilis]OWQ91870.1 ABC transporter substrate-binding protein [Roseateles aquatilis]
MQADDLSRRRLLAQAIALGGWSGAGAIGLAGCGDSRPGAAANAAASTSASTSTASALDAAASVPGGAPRRGGRLRLGVIDGSQAGNLDAHKPTAGASTLRGFALYSKLWEWSSEMTPELALAESAEVSPDAKTWTLRLRKGLEFHHGKTISADDVIFSIRRLTDPQLASPYAGLVSVVDRDRIRKLDERTVRITFRDGRGYVPLADTWVNFGGIVPTDYDPVTNPVGAGPFKLKEFNPGQRSLFTRFENYFKPGRPYPDELEIIDFKDQTSRLQALQNGQIDVVNAISPEQLPLLRQAAGLRVVVSETNYWQSFDMNVELPPFDDVRVRQAFRLIADRQALVDRALNGQGRIANDLYAPQDPTFDHTIPQRRQDLAQARALLAAAGHPSLQVELVTTAAGARAALVFAEQARQAGVRIDVKQLDQATFAGPRRSSWPLSTGGSLGHAWLVSALHADGPQATVNKTRFRDPRFVELVTAAMQQPDAAQRAPLVHEAQRIQWERGSLLIWGFANTLDAASTHVGGLAPEHSHFPTWRFDKLWLA